MQICHVKQYIKKNKEAKLNMNKHENCLGEKLAFTAIKTGRCHRRSNPSTPHPPALIIWTHLTAPTVQCEFVLMRLAQGESHILFGLGICARWDALVE